MTKIKKVSERVQPVPKVPKVPKVLGDKEMDAFEKTSTDKIWPMDIDEVPSQIPHEYLTDSSRERTFAVLGSSSNKPALQNAISKARAFSEQLIRHGQNVISGCGSKGIMGAVLYGAKDGLAHVGAGENLVMLVEPLWGDEDFTAARAIYKTTSDAERIRAFTQVASGFVLFPGGAGTETELAGILEALLSEDESVRPRHVVLVGRDTYQPYIDYLSARIANLELPEGLLQHYQLVDDVEEVDWARVPEALEVNLTMRDASQKDVARAKHILDAQYGKTKPAPMKLERSLADEAYLRFIQSRIDLETLKPEIRDSFIIDSQENI